MLSIVFSNLLNCFHIYTQKKHDNELPSITTLSWLSTCKWSFFANNCFVFEDLNGYILKHIHGTTGVETQVIRAVTMMQAFSTLKDLYIDNDEDSLLITSIFRPNYVHKNVCIEEGIYQLWRTLTFLKL